MPLITADVLFKEEDDDDDDDEDEDEDDDEDDDDDDSMCGSTFTGLLALVLNICVLWAPFVAVLVLMGA